MRELRVGESYTGDELEEILGGNLNERIWAFSNEKTVVVVVDEGNDNWKVLHVIEK